MLAFKYSQRYADHNYYDAEDHPDTMVLLLYERGAMFQIDQWNISALISGVIFIAKYVLYNERDFDVFWCKQNQFKVAS